MTPRQGDYGLDAPYAPAGIALGGAVLLGFGIWSMTSVGVLAGVVQVVVALFLFACAASYLYTSRRGKFVCWWRVLDRLGLRGDEHVLDLGCGRGAVLLMAAERVPDGAAAGVDLWRGQDQSGNAEEATRRNAEVEGVTDRVALHTGDLTALPFDQPGFDLVASSLALHNLNATGRDEAVREAARVLRPGGRLTIADIRHTERYAEVLSVAGLTDVHRESLGWRFWYGGPWVRTTLLTASKPTASPHGEPSARR